MQVEIIDNLDNLESLPGVVVVLDIFRASNTILSLLTAGADRVVLLSDLDAAYALKEQNPSWLLFGERDGLPPAGFEGGNSPAAASRMSLKGRTVIFTTSAGTQAVHRLPRAQAVMFGCFANAAALVKTIQDLRPQSVHLLPMGYKAQEPAEEDDLAAFYLKGSLMGGASGIRGHKGAPALLFGAQRLRRLNQQDDLEFCTSLDTHELVARVHFEKYPAAGPPDRISTQIQARRRPPKKTPSSCSIRSF